MNYNIAISILDKMKPQIVDGKETSVKEALDFIRKYNLIKQSRIDDVNSMVEKALRRNDCVLCASITLDKDMIEAVSNEHQKTGKSIKLTINNTMFEIIPKEDLQN